MAIKLECDLCGNQETLNSFEPHTYADRARILPNVIVNNPGPITAKEDVWACVECRRRLHQIMRNWSYYSVPLDKDS